MANKCPPCKPGAPGWLATFSDLCTLLLTFFVLLVSMASFDKTKSEPALGSVREAFGGNVLEKGEVMMPGKSPEDIATMMDGTDSVKPFPIDFKTMEGMLDKHEINRESDEQVGDMTKTLKEFELSEAANVFEVKEGIKVSINDKIYFQNGSIKLEKVTVEIFEKVVKLLTNSDWVVYVEGHASRGEASPEGKDAFALSAERAAVVTRVLIKRGVAPSRVTTLFYGDTQSDVEGGNGLTGDVKDRRVEFTIRKASLRENGKKIDIK
ncbi:MAG: OmpA/MotB family protein [Bacteriovoracaceae bacterium]